MQPSMNQKDTQIMTEEQLNQILQHELITHETKRLEVAMELM